MTLNTILPWRTATAIAIARRFRETNDAALLPILADALEDAGCDSVTVLHALRAGQRWPTHIVLGLGWWEQAVRDIQASK